MSSSPFARFRPRPVDVEFGNEPRDWTGAHTHDHTELCLLAEGSGKLLSDNDTFPLKRGDMALINRNAKHDICFYGADVLFYSVAVADLGAPEEDILKNRRFCIIPSSDAYGILRACFSGLAEEKKTVANYGADISERLLQVILLYAMRMADTEMNLPSGRNRVYAQAKEYINIRYSEPDVIKRLCESLDINSGYLAHLFRQMGGPSPVVCIARKRVELARKLLASTDAGVSEIAARCGYHDTPYFCRVFKKYTSFTPLQFRYNSRSKS